MMVVVSPPYVDYDEVRSSRSLYHIILFTKDTQASYKKQRANRP